MRSTSSTRRRTSRAKVASGKTAAVGAVRHNSPRGHLIASPSWRLISSILSFPPPTHMDFKIQDLHAIEGDDISLESLPGLCSRFFIPTLPDKPQNPIMDTLDMRREQRTSHAQATSPDSRDILRVSARLDAEETLDDNFWERVGHEPHKPSVCVFEMVYYMS